jgi:hypothetical protein
MTEILLLAMLKEVLKLLPETETLAGLSYDQNQGGSAQAYLGTYLIRRSDWSRERQLGEYARIQVK